jgi:hypothetical protein
MGYSIIKSDEIYNLSFPTLTCPLLLLFLFLFFISLACSSALQQIHFPSTLKHLSLNQKLIQFGAYELDIGFCCHIYWLVEEKQNMLDYKGFAICHIQPTLCH